MKHQPKLSSSTSYSSPCWHRPRRPCSFPPCLPPTNILKHIISVLSQASKFTVSWRWLVLLFWIEEEQAYACMSWNHWTINLKTIQYQNIMLCTLLHYPIWQQRSRFKLYHHHQYYHHNHHKGCSARVSLEHRYCAWRSLLFLHLLHLLLLLFLLLLTWWLHVMPPRTAVRTRSSKFLTTLEKRVPFSLLVTGCSCSAYCIRCFTPVSVIPFY